MDDDQIIEKSPKERKAEYAVRVATQQLINSSEFKKPRLQKLQKYWDLYDNKTTKKLRQLFNVPIPIFPGMIDTLNAQFNEPISLEFTEGDPSDYFKIQKINGAFQREIMNTAPNAKWNKKLRLARKHAIMNGRAIVKLATESNPSYKSTLDIVNLKYFHFQPRGGYDLEKHLFAGEENIERKQSDLKKLANAGVYNKEQVKKMLATGAKPLYLPDSTSYDYEESLSRFKPMGLDPDQHSYIGQPVYKLCQWILDIGGERYLLVFHPWTQTWLRFEPWKTIDSSGRYPWKSYATHEDDENFLSKAYSDDLYPAADAIVAMFNQELTNREKRNFGARAYDKDMFKDVRKLDEAMHRPDALVPADTKGGAKRISEGVYEFKVGELAGTVNLIDWIQGSLGKNTGANDLAQGAEQKVSKKASVSFAENKAISKRIGWASEPFQEMMGELGKSFHIGLIDHMPASMAVRVLGENGHDWQEITREDLSLSKDLDVLVISTDKQIIENEMKTNKREKALALLVNSPNINSKKRDEEILRNAEYDDQEIAEFMDTKTYSDKTSLAHASAAIQDILRGRTPELWYGATTAFMQKIVDYATDNRSTLKKKYDELIDFAMKHKDIVKQNINRAVIEKTREENELMMQASLNKPGGVNTVGTPGAPTPNPQTENPGVPGGVSRAMETAEQMMS